MGVENGEIPDDSVSTLYPFVVECVRTCWGGVWDFVGIFGWDFVGTDPTRVTCSQPFQGGKSEYVPIDSYRFKDVLLSSSCIYPRGKMFYHGGK